MQNHLRVFRQLAGLSQEEVAEAFRTQYRKPTITFQHVSAWERGRLTPSLENALILSQILGQSVEKLFRLE